MKHALKTAGMKAAGAAVTLQKKARRTGDEFGGATAAKFYELAHDHLGRHQFDVVAAHNLWEVRIIVFVKRQYRPMIAKVEKHHAATGIGNIVRNKGAASISFRFQWRR